MNIALWILQVLLMLHTVMGALWKLSNSEQAVPDLASLPHGVWLGLSVVELVVSLGLIVPAFRKSLGVLAPIAAVCIAAEMVSFTIVHIASGATDRAHPIYWLAVAGICAVIAIGRFVLRPISKPA